MVLIVVIRKTEIFKESYFNPLTWQRKAEAEKVAAERVAGVLEMLLVKQETHLERAEEIIPLVKSKLNSSNTHA